MTVSKALTRGAEWTAHITICLIAAAAITSSLSLTVAYAALGLLLAGTAATITASILDKRTPPAEGVPAPAPGLADRLEQLVWGAHDAELRSLGFEVTRVGRWRRSYRHEGVEAAILARARTATRASGRIEPTEAPASLLNINTRGAA